MGAFIQNCLWTFLGCLVGTFLYTLLSERITIDFFFIVIEIEKLSTKSSTHAKTVMELTGKEYPFLAVIFAMMMYLIVFIVELIRPWKQDIHNAFSLTSLDIHSYAWSPIVSSYLFSLISRYLV